MELIGAHGTYTFIPETKLPVKIISYDLKNDTYTVIPLSRSNNSNEHPQSIRVKKSALSDFYLSGELDESDEDEARVNTTLRQTGGRRSTRRKSHRRKSHRRPANRRKSHRRT